MNCVFPKGESREIDGDREVADREFVHEALRAAHIERLYEPLFAEPL
jgi:hypothetical protein